MADLAKLKRARASCKGWFQRETNKLQTLLDVKEPDTAEVTSALAEFDVRLNKWDAAQEAVEFELEEDQLEAEVLEAGEFRDKCLSVKMRATKLLTPKDDGQSVGSVNSNLRLPKINLPKFDGNVLEWTKFWESFEACVDSSDIPDVSKMTYLLSLLKGEAEQCVAGLALSAANYSVACDLLKDRFGRKEVIIFGHMQALLGIKVTEKGKLQALQDEIVKHTRSLETLGVTGDAYGVVLTPLILSRLPAEIRLEWAREGSGKEGDLPFLMDFLKKEIGRQERSSVFGSVPAPPGPGVPESRRAASGRRSLQTQSGPGGSEAHHLDRQRRGFSGRRVPSAAALQAASQQSSEQVCGFCNQGHPTEQCSMITSLPVRERMRRVRFSGLCFRCLKRGHRAQDCEVQCEVCGGRHHRICCFQDLTDHTQAQAVGGRKSALLTPSVESSGAAVTSGVKASLSCNSGDGKCVVLPTAAVLVQSRAGPVPATLLFDTGSDRSYVSESLVKRVRGTSQWLGTESVTYAAFGGGKSTCDRNVWEMSVCGSNLSHPTACDVTAVEVPVICSPLQRPRIPREALVTFTGVELADSYGADRMLSVDILVGLDQYWKLVKQGFIRSSEGAVVAQETQFGWIVSGVTSCTPGAGGAECQLLTLGDLHEDTVRRLWDLEGIGIRTEEEPAESKVLEDFNSSVHLTVEGRYEVALPWKADCAAQLQDNRAAAEARLSSLSRRLDRDPDLGAAYSEALQEMEQAGVVEEVPDCELNGPYPRFYLPHRPVVKESSVTTRVRPVFDASAAGPNGVSLNDCLEVGPSLIPSLVELLLRFRRWRVAVTADISKAFLQVGLRREDRDVHRFLWYHSDGRQRVMRFCRVTFGVNSSPFLLNATIRHHLSAYPPSRAITEMSENFYVDDLVSGADSEEEARALLAEAQAVMADAGMTLAKYKSNCPLVFDKAHAASGSGAPESVKVLGVRWSPEEDAFSFDGMVIPPDVTPTKRAVLSCIARMFDPLGFVSPFVMVAKSLFQELWQLGLDWDAELPADRSALFLDWLRGIEILKQLSIPRCYSSGGWRQGDGVSIHSFGDASPKGYGATVYLRTARSDGSIEVSLVMAKARLAPVKRVTLPRLELLGSLLAARLAVLVRQALRLPDDTATRCWTDSTIALGWIRGEPQRWKQFVSNRVTEIQSLTAPSDWSHCPGEMNPADLTTRGLPAEELVGSRLWLSGPSWLATPQGRPDADEAPGSGDELPEARAVVLVTGAAEERNSVQTESGGVCSPVAATSKEGLFDCDRWSSLSKAVRVVGWVRRFVSNARSARHRRTSGDLSAEEILSARHDLLREAQRQAYAAEISSLCRGKTVAKQSSLYRLTPYLDEDGLLRVRGRLQQSELSHEEKHPILLPKGRVAELLVRDQHRLMSHCGVSTLITAVRAAYFVVGLRCLAKRVKRSCVSCQRQDAAACNEPAAPLPRDRVTRAPPFSVTGVDFAGPIFALDFPRQKLYVCLFTCAVTRAVHLELTASLSQEEFLMALRRFAARRGLPSVIYSDNARTFTGADALLQRYFGHLAPRWKFIVPRSPWWGGWWEKLIHSVKVGLRKSLGTRCLTRIELETVLIEVESCVNSRPLTQVTDSVESENLLTPSHFLMERGAGFQARVLEDSEAVNGKMLSERARVRERRLNRFWSVWRDEYLRNLPQSVRRFSTHGKLQPGSVVLIREDNIPRMRWELGTVTKLYPGRDGVTRSAEVRTQGGHLRTRAVQRLCDLELLD